MDINRRDFFKGAAAGGLLLAAGSAPEARAAAGRASNPLGILYDSNLCIGCQACMTACKDANNMPAEHAGRFDNWDNPIDLSAKTLNIIKMYREGDEFAFIKRHCMHCLEPACASACPVSALRKDPQTGVVRYDPSACIGCRYCQVVCPYNIPKFEWNDPFPQIVKCQLCDHLYDQGHYAACCEFCPTGASLFGPVEMLKQEARRRLILKPGEYSEFPVNHIESGPRKRRMVKPYLDHIYGAEELGGSQCMILAGTDFSLLGLPGLREKSYVSDLEGVTEGIYKYMLLPVAALGGLVYLVRKRGVHD